MARSFGLRLVEAGEPRPMKLLGAPQYPFGEAIGLGEQIMRHALGGTQALPGFRLVGKRAELNHPPSARCCGSLRGRGGRSGRRNRGSRPAFGRDRLDRQRSENAEARATATGAVAAGATAAGATAGDGAATATGVGAAAAHWGGTVFACGAVVTSEPS